MDPENKLAGVSLRRFIVKYYDDFKDPRFRNAVTIGKHADMIFRAECFKRGLDPDMACESPIAALASSPILDAQPMDREQILNLWNDGLTRPEIMALGVTYPEFQQAIKTARAVGDPRAYYRQNRWSRLPWAIDLTTKAKQAAQGHRIISNPPKEPVMKNKPPFTPRPKRTTGDVGPTFVGKAVDDLVSVFAQIDEAKRRLDKRFVPHSDILRTEIANKD